MARKLFYSFGLLLLHFFCWAQHKTLLIRTGSDRDTSRIWYTSNEAGDTLSVGRSDVYRVSVNANAVFLIVNVDTVRLSFEDTGQKIQVNNDVYHLYPAFYVQLKQAVLIKHSVMAVLRLLEDAIGDYPVETARPLLLFTPQITKRIRSAKVITQRTQADMLDTWDCIYRYDKYGKLIAISAAADNEIRYSKKLNYRKGRLSTIKTYRNLESRQVTEITMTYANYPTLRWDEYTLETGKNRESESINTLKRYIKK